VAGLLLVVGDLVEDVVVWPDGPMRRGSDTASRVVRSRGGSAANVAATAAPLVATRFVGRVGADLLGDRLVRELAAAGVEVRAQRGGRTGTVVVLVEPDGERTFLSDRAAAADLAPVPAAELDEVSLLHVPAYGLHGGRTAGTVRLLLEEAVRRGLPVSLDASSWAVLRDLGDFTEVVRRVQPVVLFANTAEARELPPGLPTTLVVKNGGGPTEVHLRNGARRAFPVQPVEGVRDSTGAGDAFAAGWLSAMMAGLGIEDRVARAHVLARRVLTSPGAQAEESS
jgi:sugar/nucleoside kinase (ribokinase family)